MNKALAPIAGLLIILIVVSTSTRLRHGGLWLTGRLGYVMAVCTFFGHRYAPLTEAEKTRLTASIIDLIKNHDVTEFWLGAKGEFDSLCSSTLHKLKDEFPEIKLCLVLSYIPTNKEDYEWKERYYDHIFLPDGVEDGPQRFAITRRNRWMALNCDYMICYVKYDYGGAYAAMKVALANKKEVINICKG